MPPLLARVDPETARRALALGALRVKLRAQQAKKNQEDWVPFEYQIPPDPDSNWEVWFLMGGRGSGKTDAGAHAVNAHALGKPCIPGPVPHRMAIVSTTGEDAVDTCVRGESGLLLANPQIKFSPGARIHADLTWANGAEAALFGAFTPEDVERFRGPQHCLIWADEIASWRKLDDVVDMIELGVRLGPHPRWIMTSTPKTRRLLVEILKRPTTVRTHARTADNVHLTESRRAKLYERYGGTTLGRQELDAELITDLPGALWRRTIIEHFRRKAAPALVRIAVAIDPSVSNTSESDEAGIIVGGIDGQNPPHGYVLADFSGRMAPIDWARRGIDAYKAFVADRILGEVNNGGDMVETTLRSIDPNIPYRRVVASRGKATRAEPISAMYEQGRIHHVGSYPELEDQMCTWLPGVDTKSPDRMDALVWLFTDLLVPNNNPWAGLRNAGGVS